MGRKDHDPYGPGGPTRPPPSLPAPENHARQHCHVRQAHETELIEDYVELIADLLDTRGEARAVEIAHRRGVRQATVSKMLQRLLSQQLIETEPYRAIFLTTEGRRMAEASRARHDLVLEFLRKLGVSEEVARRDAEGIEHHVSAETLERMRRWLEA